MKQQDRPKGKIVTLEEALASVDVALIDGNLEIGERVEGYSSIYHAKSYSELDKRLLLRWLKSLRNQRILINHPKVFTVNQVSEETAELIRLIQDDKIDYLDNHNVHGSRRRAKGKWKKSRRRTVQKARENADENRELLREVQNETYELSRKMKSKSIFQIPRYSLLKRKHEYLTEMVTKISQLIHLKRDICFMDGLKSHPHDRSEESDTDERLAAALLYLNMASNKSHTLITRDTNLITLIGVTPRLIGADDFLPFNKAFRNSLQSNPPRIYFEDIEGYEQGDFRFEDEDYKKPFKLKHTGFNEENRAKAEIHTLWKKFNTAKTKPTPH